MLEAPYEKRDSVPHVQESCGNQASLSRWKRNNRFRVMLTCDRLMRQVGDKEMVPEYNLSARGTTSRSRLWPGSKRRPSKKRPVLVISCGGPAIRYMNAL